jgi:hypothetical protein
MTGNARIRKALSEVSRARTALDTIGETLESLHKGAGEKAFTAQPGEATFPPDHRRAHRPGRVPKIDSDPELRAFIEARIDAMTFNEVADAVAAAFPPERRVRKSAIHEWWHKR